VIEKLHFRHFWMFLAMACALAEPVEVRPPAIERARPLLARAAG